MNFLILREYFPSDFNIFKDGIVLPLILIFVFVGFFLLGYFIIHKQVALIKKGEFNLQDRFQCFIYGFIFSMAVMIVLGMGVIFTINTPDFWIQQPWQSEPPTPPKISPLFLIIPFLICLAYITFYPLIDFLFIALNKDSDEGLTPFHKFIGDHWINLSNKKPLRIIMALILWFFLILPPFIFWALGLPFILIMVSFMLFYPLMILTFYGSKGYIAGISNFYYHMPDIKRSIFLGFEDRKRVIKEFSTDPGPRIMLGLMLFVFVWAWISMIQTIAFYFTGSLAISTMSSLFVFVTLFFGILGYFTRFWGRKIKYRAIDIYFAAYLMAAIGINVLVNFMIVNPEKLFNAFNYTIIGLHEIIPNYLMFAFAAVIEETVLIIFTSYYFLSRNNEFIVNLKYSKITECGQKFDPIPLFNFIKSRNPKVRKHAEETLFLMFERIPKKENININHYKFKHSIMDGICDPNPNVQRISLRIFLQLEKDMPDIILPWIIEGLESPNYDKIMPVARSLLTADIYLVEKIQEEIIYSLITDSEWRLKLIGLKILSRLIKKNNNLIINLLSKRYLLNDLINNPDNHVQVEVLNILAEYEVVLPSETILNRIFHSNKEIRAAAIKNIKNLDIKHVNRDLIFKLIPLMKDSSSSVRASIFQVFAKIGRFKKYNIPISPFIDGLADLDQNVRNSSVLALEKYYNEEPKKIDLDEIISKIDPSNNEVLESVLSLLGRIWDKDPNRILTTLLIFIRFNNSELKENISKILVEKFTLNPDLIFTNLIKIQDDVKFVTKGIVARTLITLGKQYPKIIIPRLYESLISKNIDIQINTVTALEGLVEDNVEMFELKPFIKILDGKEESKIKRETSKIISKIAKLNPLAIKPVMNFVLQSLNQQESSVKVVLAKSLLEIAKESPNIIPIRPVIFFLTDEDPFIRESAARILGYISVKNLVNDVTKELVEKGIKDEEWIVREASVISLGKILNDVKDKELIIKEIILLFDDNQAWVQKSAINIISNIDNIKASEIPYDKVMRISESPEPKVREASAGLFRIYGATSIDRIFEKILSLLGDDIEEVRISMMNSMVDIVQKIGLEKLLSKLLKHLSDDYPLNLQRSISIVLGRTALYEDEKIKKRVIALLKIRCEMSQDPIICKTLHKLKES